MASGNTMFVFTPQQAEPPTTGYAQFDTRNNIAILAFDTTSPENCVFRGVLPSNYGNGGLTVDIYGMAASATAGSGVLGLAMERDNVANHDLDADAFATEQQAGAVTDATSGKVFKITVTLSNGAVMDSAVAGDPFRLRLQRKVTAGDDTMAGDYQFLAMHGKET